MTRKNWNCYQLYDTVKICAVEFSSRNESVSIVLLVHIFQFTHFRMDLKNGIYKLNAIND